MSTKNANSRNENDNSFDGVGSKKSKKTTGCFGRSKKPVKSSGGGKVDNKEMKPKPKERTSLKKKEKKGEAVEEMTEVDMREVDMCVSDTETDGRLSMKTNGTEDKTNMPLIENSMKTSNKVVQNYSHVISSMRQSFQASDLRKAFPTVNRPVPVVRSERARLTHKFRKEEYKMDHSSRGRVLIVINDRFTNPDQDIGAGPATDVTYLPTCLVKLGFSPEDIRIFRNLTVDQLDNTLEHFCKEDYTNSDCAVILILSQGKSDNHFSCSDEEYNVINLWKMLASCKTLHSKPKLVFIQSGQLKEETDHRSSRYSNKLAPLVQYSIPMRPDFLLAYSTQPGIYDEGSDEGSRFIPALCEEIEDMNTETDHLAEVLTKVVNRIHYRQSRQELDIRRQSPVVITTLMYKLYFRQH